eukprot:CAMPEP_0194313908 /NCGR_PEP_ID=MMETSP0171-20130528/10735_1 /TAXON_ID=218684 /ORGANISM="Corethron pennatum, Strain L29A3" /LENGTH=266 /DNA_ID=CAMNT_0039069057 /DNA_START=124 /DNA_END=924 /DNA_ORIENTATION=+
MVAAHPATTPLDLLESFIADLESRLNIFPGQSPDLGVVSAANKVKAPPPGSRSVESSARGATQDKKKEKKEKKAKKGAAGNSKKGAPAAADADADQPDICKLSFKVGVITKVWTHPDADRLYCEEIDVGEETGPRRIASGLREHYTEEGMLGRRLLVIANLKPKNLKGFKSHGMVLCAASSNPDGSEKVEFVEPPAGATIGEQITFGGLPPPRPLSGAQVEKKKVFQKCLDGLRTTEEGVAAWNGHAFLTSAGPCRCPTVVDCPLR